MKFDRPLQITCRWWRYYKG